VGAPLPAFILNGHFDRAGRYSAIHEQNNGAPLPLRGNSKRELVAVERPLRDGVRLAIGVEHVARYLRSLAPEFENDIASGGLHRALPPARNVGCERRAKRGQQKKPELE